MRYDQAFTRIGGRPEEGRGLVGGCVYTIGHSNHPAREFVGLLREHGIEVLVDTRSRPYSGYAPHFNAGALQETLSGCGIRYHFFGGELGGRPRGEEFYDAEGRVDYARLEKSRPFLEGLRKLERRIRAVRVALLCSEEDPAACHRWLLVGRALIERGIDVRHIRGDGRLQKEGETAQPALFPDAEVGSRKSIRSVSRRRRRRSSSGR